MGRKAAQARPPHLGTIEQPVPGKAMQRLHRKFPLSLRDRFHVLGADQMCLRYMGAQDLTLPGLYSKLFVPIWQR